ncbi:MAG TPA: ATP-dependent DNA helicase RecG [Saprospiraceae bacterium]|nr:ATP-dependent DNA helicase RecG [Saprospiraceae bacterium]
MSKPNNILDSSIEFLKGVGPVRAELLKKELGLHTFRDLLLHFPFRYIDKTSFNKTTEPAADGDMVQYMGKITDIETIDGKGSQKRLSAEFSDGYGSVELVWFQRINWIEEYLEEGLEYIVYGRLKKYGGKKSIVHPEVEKVTQDSLQKLTTLFPVYSTTEKLNARNLHSRAISNLTRTLTEQLKPGDIPDFIPDYLMEKLRLRSFGEAVLTIHYPKNEAERIQAENRIKFNELFLLQLRLLYNRQLRKRKIRGIAFEQIGQKFNDFFHKKLQFELTEAQKRVVKELRRDMGSGIQMNRLLQGDVGSGKTIVALLCMLIAIDNGCQACLMAPTEILAYQHFQSITKMTDGLGIQVGFLTGSVKGKVRKELLFALEQGNIHILVGTHALLEKPVKYARLGLAITDEQHRFGVQQRARLWTKAMEHPPHILVMTATPIPRTLSMTLYGDLDVSVIDELPPGRKSIRTIHSFESKRPKLTEFLRTEIGRGRQVYVVYPLIEESETLDLKNLQDGYEQILHHFPRPDYQISVVHGRMKPQDKEFEMNRFKKGITHILVSTTVIEVGVDVPNASVMVIENAERFGLSQLHQLRGRVGRGAEQSYCILMSGNKLSNEARERIQTMVRTNNGFEIAEVDLKLRGPGDIEGIRQSGMLDLKMANLVTDTQILQTSRQACMAILEEDPELNLLKNKRLKAYLEKNKHLFLSWGRIS